MAGKQKQSSEVKTKRKMKIFQTFRNHCEIWGFSPNQSTHLFNRRITAGILIQCLTLTIEFVYIFRESHNFKEYLQSINLISATAVAFIGFLVILFQMKVDSPFQLITKIENLCDGGCKFLQITNIHFLTNDLNILEMGDSKLYAKTNASVEKFSELVVLLMPKMSPILFVLPIPVASYFIYFTTDAGNDAFHLPYQMWCELIFRFFFV